MNKYKKINSNQIIYKTEELLEAANNRYKITVQVANRAKRRKYEPFFKKWNFREILFCTVHTKSSCNKRMDQKQKNLQLWDLLGGGVFGARFEDFTNLYIESLQTRSSICAAEMAESL